MNSEINNGKCCDRSVEEDGMPVSVPSAVVIKTGQTQPNSKWNSNVERGHTVSERVNTTEPISNLRSERIRQGLHFWNRVTCHSNVEKQIERDRQNIHPCNRERHSVCEPAVIKICEVKDRDIANKHESSHIKVS